MYVKSFVLLALIGSPWAFHHSATANPSGETCPILQGEFDQEKLNLENARKEIDIQCTGDPAEPTRSTEQECRSSWVKHTQAERSLVETAGRLIDGGCSCENEWCEKARESRECRDD